MSLEHPLDYLDAAAEILDEVMTKELPLKLVMEKIENAVIITALTNAGGNKAKAARILGMNRTTLQMRLGALAAREVRGR